MGINAFKQNVQDLGRANRFRVVNVVTNLEFYCKAAQIPGATVNPMEVPYMGRTLKYAGDRVYDDWEITVFADSAGDIRRAFEDWHTSSMTHESNLGADLADYANDLRVQMLNRQDVPILDFTIVGCWPTVLGTIDLDWSSNDTPAEFTVTLAYDEYQIG
jgi:hypothetical protein